MRPLEPEERDLVRYLHTLEGMMTCMQLCSGHYCRRTRTLCGRPLTQEDIAFVIALNDNAERVLAVAESVRLAGLDKGLENAEDVDEEYFRLIDAHLGRF